MSCSGETKGIDVAIEDIKDDISAGVVSAINGTNAGTGTGGEILITDSIDANGRVFVVSNKYEGRNVPRLYLQDNDYKDIYLNDNKDLTYFFLVDGESTTEDGVLFKNKTRIVFMLNIENLYGSANGRADEKARIDVVSAVRESSFGRFDILGLQLGLDNVFRGLDFSGLKYADTHPFHTFAINTELNYYL